MKAAKLLVIYGRCVHTIEVIHSVDIKFDSNVDRSQMSNYVVWQFGLLLPKIYTSSINIIGSDFSLAIDNYILAV